MMFQASENASIWKTWPLVGSPNSTMGLPWTLPICDPSVVTPRLGFKGPATLKPCIWTLARYC